MVLNRPLRPRRRRLPPPPNQVIPNPITNYHQEIRDEATLQPQTIFPQPQMNITNEYPQGTLPPLKTSGIQNRSPIYSGAVPPGTSEWNQRNEQQNKEYSQKGIGSTDLLSELADVISQGIDSKLEKVDFDSIESEKDLDYATILKTQFEKAIEDYMEAGKKFQESGLKSNAAMSFACAVFSSVLGSGENYARHKWNLIKEEAGDEFKTSSLFSIIEQMFSALDKRSKEGIYEVLNLLKRLDTFSIEDQELIANTASYLIKRSEIF